MSDTRSFMALDWVKSEIQDTLDRAREALEAYAERPDDTTLARQCLTSLHQVNGTLQMVELTGAATLAGEMEALAQALMNRSVVDEERAQEALMEGILQLPSHLDRVHRGAEDDPGAHAKLIDRMRTARGEAPLATAGGLAVEPEALEAFLEGRAPPEVRRIRAASQKALVALLRGTQPPEKLYRFFDKAFTRLEQLVPASPLRTLWSVAAGAMEAERLAGGDPKSALPLLRGLDQQLKALAQDPEAALTGSPPAELLDDLKAVVEASSDPSPRLEALREALAGAEAPPELPIGADEATIAMVATALHEELGGVRDRLDLFVRGGAADPEGLVALGDDLQRAAGTLQVAGLDELRETIARQAAWLRSQANAGTVGDDAIMEVASAVLFVDGELMRLAGIESSDGDGMPGSLSDAQTAVLKEARGSLEAVKQGIVDFIASDWEHAHLEAVPGTLANVRSVLDLIPLEEAAQLVERARAYVDDEVLGPQSVPEWQRLDNLADAITSIDYYLERLIEDRVIPDPRLLEIAAESIENLSASDPSTAAPAADARPGSDGAAPHGAENRASDPDATVVLEPSDDDRGALPATESALTGEDAAQDRPSEFDATAIRAPADAHADADAQDLGSTLVRAPEELAPTEISPDADTDVNTDVTPYTLDEPEFELPEAPESAVVSDASVEAGAAIAAQAPANADADADADAERDADLIDDEILEIFVEEVGEVLEHIDAALPRWRAQPEDEDALAELRRAYHTLKGSGRMVGAGVLGELSWSVENMLNRVIDGTIPPAPPLMDLTEAVRDLIPALREAFAEQREADLDVTPWMERADVLASGGGVEDLDDLPLPEARESASVRSRAPIDDASSASTTVAEDDFDLGVDLDGEVDELPAAEPESGEAADRPSEVPEVAETSERDEQPEAASAARGEDASTTPEEAAPTGGRLPQDLPSELTTPVEDDFDLDGMPEITAGTAETAIDETSDPTARLEDDFDLGAGFESSATPSDEEPSLLEIFEQEAEEHLAPIRDFVDEARATDGVAPLTEALGRGLHTLKGSAAMADYPRISALAAPLESLVRSYLDLRRQGDEALTAIMETGLGRMEAGLVALRENPVAVATADDEAFLGEAQLLLQRVQGELRDLGGDGANARRFFADARVEQLLDAARVLGEWAAAGVTTRVEALRRELDALAAQARSAGEVRIAALAAALHGAHERLDRRLPPEARPVLEDAHEALVGALDALAADLGQPVLADHIDALEALAKTVPPAAAAAPDAAGVPQTTEHPEQRSESVAALDLDPEMVEIFFEEAEEILETVEGALERWPAGDTAAPDELMRALHTLKGGARMAGLTGLGEEAHDLETWIDEQRTRIEGDGGAAERFFSELHERADVMAGHVAMLRRGETVVHRVSVHHEHEHEHEHEQEQGHDHTEAPAADAAASVGRNEPVLEPAMAPPAAPPESEPAMDAAEDAIDDDVAETDPEILALFLEEAGELTEMLDGSLQGWREAPGNEIHMESVLRALHTLKGGARMAGLMALGERMHDLETRITDRRSAGDALDGGFLGEVQSEIDALSQRIAGLGAVPGAAPTAADAAAHDAPAPAAVDDAPAPASAVPDLRGASFAEAPVTATPASAAEPDSAPAQRRETARDAPQEMIRVSSGLLDELVSLAGETSIMRGRVQQQINDFGAALGELSSTIERVGDQIRRLDSEAQEQVLSRQEAAQRAERAGYEDFDPLEMDRYTQLQELTRTLAESASDIGDLRDTLAEQLRDADTLLVQQGRINTELQEGLMRTRMVPFARLLPRLKRIVRQVGRELGKPVELLVENAEGELDRNVLERMIAPLEHMLRNAVDHGLETPEARAAAGKAPQGTIRLRLDREGGDILVRVSDDGRGIDVAGVRAKAVERGLLEADAEIGEAEILSFIMAAGFSTAKSVTQISGRGVGMDVVNSEVKQLGGTIAIASKLGEGTTFTVRLPFTVSVNRALMVRVGDDMLAVPLNGIEGIVRVSPAQLIAKYETGAGATFSYAGREYGLSYLGEWLGDPRRVADDVPSIPIIMVRSGDLARAVHVDAIAGSREVVVKSLGGHFAGVGGVSGATILGDGTVVVILDLPALLRSSDPEVSYTGTTELASEERAGPVHVMVVDDSVTVRKVTTRLLERKGYRVTVAKDGVEAVAALAEEKPDIMLLDIEMPRMDGFEVATHVRNEAGLGDLPIIMITSRTGDKHRERAGAIGVNRFLGKPFQEPELLAEIEALSA